ncbi:MAG: hypothetical protein WC877_01310 [Dehalococcoidales bacterium]|jgi:hypothetical protein
MVIFITEPGYYEYIKNIKLIREKYGFEEPLKRDGKVFEEDIRDLAEKIEFLQKQNTNKEVDELKNAISKYKCNQNANKDKVKINIDGDENKDSPYEFGEEIADKISEKLKNEIKEDISRYKFKRNEKKALDEVNKIMNDPVTKEMAKKVINKVDNMEESKPVSRNSLLLKSDNMKSLERVIDTINRKDKQYFKDPIQVLSTDDLLTQIKIKAIRAKLTFDDEKRMDELLDIAVYSILTLEKMLIEPVGEHTGVENYK